MRREYGVDSATLKNKEWVNLYAEYKYTEKQRYELTVTAFKQALTEIINQMLDGQ